LGITLAIFTLIRAVGNKSLSLRTSVTLSFVNQVVSLLTQTVPVNVALQVAVLCSVGVTIAGPAKSGIESVVVLLTLIAGDAGVVLLADTLPSGGAPDSAGSVTPTLVTLARVRVVERVVGATSAGSGVCVV